MSYNNYRLRRIWLEVSKRNGIERDRLALLTGYSRQEIGELTDSLVGSGWICNTINGYIAAEKLLVAKI